MRWLNLCESKEYTLGQMIDELKPNQIAIKVRGNKVGEQLYVDTNDKYQRFKFCDTNAEVVIYYKENKKETDKWIIVDKT